MASTKIPNMSSLRNSQVLVGQGLFKGGQSNATQQQQQQQQHSFDPMSDMVSVEELVQSVKHCEDRLNHLRQGEHEANHHHSQVAKEVSPVVSPVPKVKVVSSANVRARSPVPLAQRPAWGRKTPQHTDVSPMGTPRTRPSHAEDTHDRPWRSGSKPPLTPQHRNIETIDKEDSPPADESPSQFSPRRNRGSQALRSNIEAPRTAATKKRVPTVRSPSPNTADATQRRGLSAQPRTSSVTSTRTATPKKQDSDMDLVLKRLAAMEATVSTLQQHNEGLTQEVVNLRSHNLQLQQQQQMMGTDLNGKWVALSSQLQYFMQQPQYQVHPPVQHCAINIPSSATHHQEHQERKTVQQQQEDVELAAFVAAGSVGVTPPRPFTAGSTNPARRLDMSADTSTTSVCVPPSPPLAFHLAGTSPSTTVVATEEPEHIIHY